MIKSVLSNLTKLLLLSVLIVWLNPLTASESKANTKTESPEREFLRLVENTDHKALQISIVRYIATDSDLSVDLISAVHVADSQYYHDLNELFKQYDAVLYELVAPEGTIITKSAKQNKNLLSMVQMGMKNILGLSFQLEEIDYTPSNFVHADMTPTEFSKSMEERGESILGTVISFWRAGMAQQLSGQSKLNDYSLISAFLAADREHALKLLFAKEFENMGGVLSTLEGEKGSTLLTERNKKALSVLSREIAKGKQSIAIFYGAAHMHDLGKRLQAEFKLEPVSEHWIDAWNLNQ